MLVAEIQEGPYLQYILQGGALLLLAIILLSVPKFLHEYREGMRDVAKAISHEGDQRRQDMQAIENEVREMRTEIRENTEACRDAARSSITRDSRP